MKKLIQVKKNTVYPLISLPQPQAESKRSWLFVAMECIAVFLAFIVLSISIGSVEQAQWTNPQPPLMTMLILALIVSFILAKVRIPGVISIAFVEIVFHARSIPLIIRIIIALIGPLLLGFIYFLALKLLTELKKPLQLVLRSWIYGLIRIFFRPRLTTGATKTRNKTRAD